MALAEVNENYIGGYLVDGVDVDPQLYFQHHLGWEMVDNTLDKDSESGEVDGIRLRASRGTLRDHNIVIDPIYCVEYLVDENKCWSAKQPCQKQKCTN